jgi:DNA-binding LacI/PurR family transcriptional regulator
MYRQLADKLRDEIKALRYRVGEYLPSERDIARHYKVTRITVRGALRALDEEGILSSEPYRCRKVISSPSEKGSIELLFFKWQSPFSDPILADFCTGVAVQAQTMGYNLVLSYISESDAIERHLDRLDPSPSRGMIVIGSYEWYGPAMPRIESKYPVVLVGTPHGSLRADVIAPDFEGAMSLAMGHLRSMGYERVKLLGGGFPEEEGRDQRNSESFKQAGLQFGFSPAKMSVFSTREVCGRKLAPHEPAGLRIDDTVLNGCTFPMAMVATAPTYATEVLALARTKRLRVPEDIAIISTQDCRTLATLPTPVTAISIFGREVGVRAVMLLDDRLQKTTLPRRMERAEIHLTVRGSCREPASMIVAPNTEAQKQVR